MKEPVNSEETIEGLKRYLTAQLNARNDARAKRRMRDQGSLSEDYEPTPSAWRNCISGSSEEYKRLPPARVWWKKGGNPDVPVTGGINPIIDQVIDKKDKPKPLVALTPRQREMEMLANEEPERVTRTSSGFKGDQIAFNRRKEELRLVLAQRQREIHDWISSGKRVHGYDHDGLSIRIGEAEPPKFFQ